MAVCTHKMFTQVNKLQYLTKTLKNDKDHNTPLPISSPNEGLKQQTENETKTLIIT